MLRRSFGEETVKSFKKNGSVKMSKRKFSMKKKQEERKNTKEYVALSKQTKKWKQVRNTFFIKKKSM